VENLITEKPAVVWDPLTREETTLLAAAWKVMPTRALYDKYST
jgi:hypothetical protein